MVFFGTSLDEMYKRNTIKSNHSTSYAEAKKYIEETKEKYFLLREDDEKTMDDWKAPKRFYDEVSENIDIPDPSITVPVEGKPSKQQPYNSPKVEDTVYNCRINDAGKMESLLENFRLDLAKYLRCKEGQDLMDMLSEEHDAPVIRYLSRGGKGLMSIGGGVFARALQYYNKIAAEAEALDMSVDEYLALHPEEAADLIDKAAMAEEIVHLYRDNDISTIAEGLAEERETKETVKAFYKKRGNKRSVALLDDDLDTMTERYLALYRSGSKRGYSRRDVDALVQKLYEAAREDGADEETAREEAVTQAEAEMTEEEGAAEESSE